MQEILLVTCKYMRIRNLITKIKKVAATTTTAKDYYVSWLKGNRQMNNSYQDDSSEAYNLPWFDLYQSVLARKKIGH